MARGEKPFAKAIGRKICRIERNGILEPAKWKILLCKTRCGTLCVSDALSMDRKNTIPARIRPHGFSALKITPNPDRQIAGIHLLHPEVYGGALLNTWFDRDLGIAESR